MSMDPTEFLVALLFDAELRSRLATERDDVLAEHLAPEERASFEALDLAALELDAQGRARYLMGSFCRSFPLSAGAIGSTDGGREGLAAFLASRHVFARPEDRTRAWGDHLQRLLELRVTGLPAPVLDLMKPVLAWESKLVRNAARIREDVAQGLEVPTTVEAPRDPGDGVLAQAPYLVVAELPVPLAVVRAALENPGPEEVWARVDARRFEPARLSSVGRGDRDPVTALARGLAQARTVEPAVAGVAPLVEVVHRTAEVRGRVQDLFAEVDGTRAIDDLSPRHRDIARGLVQAGMLVVC